MCRYKFSYVPGYFVDPVEAAKACPGSKLRTQPNLGLLSSSAQSSPEASPWAQFQSQVEDLNQYSGPLESYKLLYLVRHGLSVHNIVMAKVGSHTWNNHLCYLDGDEEVSWVDAKLTEDGVGLARRSGQLWVEWTESNGVPLPETVYTSPLARCLETTKLVYSDVMIKQGRDFSPVVKELLRERLTNHTCDRRSSRSWISKNYPECILEQGFEEEDLLWRTDRVETNDAHVARKQRLLEDIFANDGSLFVSLTTHSFAISAILETVGAPHFRVSEGAIFPLLIRAEKVPSGD